MSERKNRNMRSVTGAPHVSRYVPGRRTFEAARGVYRVGPISRSSREKNESKEEWADR